MKLYYVLGGGCLAGPVVAAAYSFDHQFALRPRTAGPVLTYRNADKHAILWRRAGNPSLIARDFDDFDGLVLHTRSPAGSKGGKTGSKGGSPAGSNASGMNSPREQSPSPRPQKQVTFNTPTPSPDPGRSVSPSMESSGTPFRVSPEIHGKHSRPPSGSPSPGPTDRGRGRGASFRGGPSHSPRPSRGGSSAGSDYGTTRGGYRDRGSPGSNIGRGGRSRGSSSAVSQASSPRTRSRVLFGADGQAYPNPFAVPVGVPAPYHHAEHQGGFNQFSFHGPQSAHNAQSIQAHYPGSQSHHNAQGTEAFFPPSSSTRLSSSQWTPATVTAHSGGSQGYLETRHGLTGGHMRDSTRVAPIMPSQPNDPSTVIAQNPEAVHGVADATALHTHAMSGTKATGTKAVGTKITAAPGGRAAIISTAPGQRMESVKTAGGGGGAVAMWSENHTSDAGPIQHTAFLRGSGRIQTSAFNVPPPDFFRTNQGQGM